MRELVANYSLPSDSIAKWIIEEFNKVGNIYSETSVKNSKEVVNKLKDMEFNDDEIIVSYNVTTLFPSIPLKEAISILEDKLVSLNTTPEGLKKAKLLKKLAAICMIENYFNFRGRFFKTNKVTAMSNPLSPLISEIFMASLEKKMALTI